VKTLTFRVSSYNNKILDQQLVLKTFLSDDDRLYYNSGLNTKCITIKIYYTRD